MKRAITILLLAALLLTMPVTACAAEEAPVPTDLVTDAFSYETEDEWSTYVFAVPRIDREGEGIQAVNDAIWQDIYEEELYSEYGAMTAIEEGWSPEPYNVTYDWAMNGDMLSLWTVSSYSNDFTVYSIYNVSLTAGRRVTDGELLDAVGVSRDEFYDLAAQALSDAFEQSSAIAPEDEFKAQQREATNAPANVRAVRPYLDGNGDLCAVGWVSAMAGAGEYARQLTIMTADQLPHAPSSADLPAQAPADERLVYFIEHSDSEILTQRDIDTFDADMCVYAVNGVYARAGRVFQSEQLRAFFEQFDWYAPTIQPDQFTDGMLSDIQTANIRLVLDYQEQRGF